jgi:hypothetical protein
MKIKSAKIVCLAFMAAALTAVPAFSQTATNTPAATAPAHPKHGLPTHGKVAAVDTSAMTFTIGTNTYAVTSETKISKLGKPAVLSDVAVGENVNVYYRKDDDGKSTAVTVRVVQPRKAAAPAATGTNAAPSMQQP